MKFAYIGIDLFLPALQILLDENQELVELFTCETDDLTEFHDGVTALAVARGVPVTTERIRVADFKRLQEKGCDSVICAGYYYKIPVCPELPTVNIHPSLLPYGRGGWPMPYDILNHRKTSGVTIHKIAEGFDTGDILLQRAFDLEATETLETLMNKVYALLPEMLHMLVTDFDSLYRNARPQGEGVYLPMPEKEMYTITPNTPFEKAELILRAFYGYDCYYKTKDAEYRLIRAKAVRSVQECGEECCFPLKDGYVVCGKNDVLQMK